MSDAALYGIGLDAGTVGLRPREDERVLQIDPAKTRDNPHQPRRTRNPDADREFYESVRTHGVTQPIVVLPADEEGVRTIVCGHRRRDACLVVGAHGLPAIERSYSDEALRIVAVIENLQRENMAPVDEVTAVAGLATHLGNKAAAQALGRSAQYVAKMVKIAQAGASIQALLASGYSTDLGAFYDLAVLHSRHPATAERLAQLWLEQPGARVSLRRQVARLRAQLDGAPGAGGRAKRKARALHFEPQAWRIEEAGEATKTLTFEMNDGSTVSLTLTAQHLDELKRCGV